MVEFTSPVGPILIYALAGGMGVVWLVVLVAGIVVDRLYKRFARHREMAEYTRAWAKKYFALFPEERHASLTLTTITNTRSISVADLNKELGKLGMQISNGYGDLKEKTFRIAHMGELTMADIREVTGAIEKILKLS